MQYTRTQSPRDTFESCLFRVTIRFSIATPARVLFILLLADGDTVNGRGRRSAIKGAARRATPWPLGSIEDSWLAPRGRGTRRRTEAEVEAERQAVTVAVAVAATQAETERKRETHRREDERWLRREEDEAGGKGVAAAGESQRERSGAERRYENGVKEKKKSGQIIGKNQGGTRAAPRREERRQPPWLRGGIHSLAHSEEDDDEVEEENRGAGREGGVAPRQFRTRVQRSLPRRVTEDTRARCRRESRFKEGPTRVGTLLLFSAVFRARGN